MSLIAALTVFAQQTAPGGTPAPNPLLQLLPFILLIGAMWFLLFAPQRKKEKEHKKMVETLAAGDEILLTGGIYGEITSVRPDRFIVRIGDNTKVEVNRAFIHGVVKKAKEDKSGGK